MVELSATVDGAASRAFDAALKELAASLGDASSQAPRMAALQMTRNFQAATKMSKSKRPVFVRKLGSEDTDRPLWVTWDNKKSLQLNPGKRLIRVLFPERKWSYDNYFLLRGLETSDELVEKMKKEYSHLYTFKEKPTGTRGLAKRSWGWVRHNIYERRPMDSPWKMRRGDVRNPMDATTESTSSVNNGVTTSRGYARVCNRLDYIKNAMTLSEDQIIQKAANAIIITLAKKKMRKMGGMSSAEIKAEAESVKTEFMRQFNPATT